jgi:hypothetical protein
MALVRRAARYLYVGRSTRVADGLECISIVASMEFQKQCSTMRNFVDDDPCPLLADLLTHVTQVTKSYPV